MAVADGAIADGTVAVAVARVVGRGRLLTTDGTSVDETGAEGVGRTRDAPQAASRPTAAPDAASRTRRRVKIVLG